MRGDGIKIAWRKQNYLQLSHLCTSDKCFIPYDFSVSPSVFKAHFLICDSSLVPRVKIYSKSGIMYFIFVLEPI